MSRRSFLSDNLYDYIVEHSAPPDPLLERLREETTEATGQWAGMQISRDQGKLMQILARAVGARRTLEVGTFTGYSALVVAQALPADGKVVACDVSEEWTAIGRKYWEEAGVADRIDLRISPATKTLDELIDAGQSGAFDMMFIDADKTGYDNYYERGLVLLRPGGLVLIDNVLWGGSVTDPDKTDESTTALKALNDKIRDDGRVMAVMLGIGDGLTVALKL
ncbi:MAG: SAM-dependent methyltransferase [Alphaproteobacteria bacterium]|nr:SAM-dependent methyltransferase [Alphaproteobacteria bacterium]